MPDCIFHQAAGDCFVCQRCGRPLRTHGAARLPLRRRCRAVVIDAPLRTEAEVAVLMRACRTNACGSFDAVRDACRRCGCAATRRAAWLARLRAGKCPAEKW